MFDYDNPTPSTSQDNVYVACIICGKVIKNTRSSVKGVKGGHMSSVRKLMTNFFTFVITVSEINDRVNEL